MSRKHDFVEALLLGAHVFVVIMVAVSALIVRCLCFTIEPPQTMEEPTPFSYEQVVHFGVSHFLILFTLIGYRDV